MGVTDSEENPEPALLNPGTLFFFSLQGMELGCVETSNFEGRAFTVPGDPGETTLAQVSEQML